MIHALEQGRRCLLLCACKDYRTCHRDIVARLLQQVGVPVTHLVTQSLPPEQVRVGHARDGVALSLLLTGTQLQTAATCGLLTLTRTQSITVPVAGRRQSLSVQVSLTAWPSTVDRRPPTAKEGGPDDFPLSSRSSARRFPMTSRHNQQQPQRYSVSRRSQRTTSAYDADTMTDDEDGDEQWRISAVHVGTTPRSAIRYRYTTQQQPPIPGAPMTFPLVRLPPTGRQTQQPPRFPFQPGTGASGDRQRDQRPDVPGPAPVASPLLCGAGPVHHGAGLSAHSAPSLAGWQTTS